MDSIRKAEINRRVMKAIEEHPGKFFPIAFLRNVDFDRRIEWIVNAVKTFDNIEWAYKMFDIEEKCVIAKIYRETKNRNAKEFGYSRASYFETLIYCEEKYPASFHLVFDTRL